MAELAILALQNQPQLDAIESWLDPVQIARLAAISHPARQFQFCAARYLAIELLRGQSIAPYLQIQPSGRPQARDWPAPDGLSWSHTKDWAAAALGLGKVGVDIETIRPRRNLLAIAEQYFTTNEFEYLASLPSATQLRSFYMQWVAKEALLKALGTGIVGGLNRFELLLDSAGNWTLSSSYPGDWRVTVWGLTDDTLCAVATDTQQPWHILDAKAQCLLQAPI
jgi:4'-phosphopantetheinyl transferase